MSAIVVTPTYNEKDNVETFIRGVLEAGAHVVIVDDNSPDGTSKIVEALARKDGRVHLIVLTRPQRLGRAGADRAGMLFALEHGFDYIFQMDADLSHRPEDIPRFLEAIRHADVVIGSRLIRGGRIQKRGILRNLITQAANVYIRLVLGLKIRDCSSGFRCYRREVLASLDWKRMISPGPSLLEEILYACHRKGYCIREIPITFTDREKGYSKLGILELMRMLLLILRFRFRGAI